MKSLLHRAVDSNMATGKKLILKLMSTKVALVPNEILICLYFEICSGIVTNMDLTHATPMALYAHVTNRKWYNDQKLLSLDPNCSVSDIAKQLIYNEVGQNINVVFGGGRENFLLDSTEGTVYILEQ